MPKYDLAVVGAGLGGLATAAVLSRKNKKVLLLSPGNEPGGVLAPFSRDGLFFAPGPSLSFDFGSRTLFGRLFSDLGLTLASVPSASSYQVVLPDHRITVYRDHNQTLEELRREFPREIDVLSKFYRDIQKETGRTSQSRLSAYLSKKRSAEGFIRKYRFSSKIRTFFDLQARYFYQAPVSRISHASLMAMIDTMPCRVEDGFKTVVDQVLDVALKCGGDVRFQEAMPEIVFRKNSVAGLKTSRDLAEAKTYLFNTVQHEQGTTLFFGIRDEVVPLRMCRDVIYLPDYGHPEQFYSLSLGSSERPIPSGGALRALTAVYRSTSQPSGPDWDHVEYINAVIPFLQEHLVFARGYETEKLRYVFPHGITFDWHRSGEHADRLVRASSRNTWLMNDDVTSPAGSVAAALRLAARLR